eukprot:CAMPEP_0119094890 /NCGR_PEP_ID=MMETSP1178-20130426/167777_1 /TAXON_ID=33656 /ORGANISM="unid sp, Strain CCMP2000" /LENGTH=171 /DNA_ID=CAMNT_0007078661 /DNA_START=47 /DNA_END=562 /DNA_ORIENTATION=-
MEPNSPVLVTTLLLDMPSGVCLGKPTCEEASTTNSAVPRPKAKTRWLIKLGAFVVLGVLGSCVASCIACLQGQGMEPRQIERVHTDRSKPDCQSDELSPLQRFHLGAQVHFHLRNRACHHEQRAELQSAERARESGVDCRDSPTGLLQRLHVGAQVHSALRERACLAATGA